MTTLGSTGSGALVIIHAGNAHQFCAPARPHVAGQPVTFGLVPRNMTTHPVGCYRWAAPPTFPLIDMGEYPDRIRDKTAARSWLNDIRMKTGPGGKMIPSRDQNGRGYCWRHSGTSAHLLIRAVENEPYIDLSAYAGACRIKHFADEGGWGAQGVDDIIAFGDPDSKHWPQQSTDRANDNPETWANAKLNRITGQWADLSADQYDRNLTFQQYCTLFFANGPGVTDFNWWSHSVCGIEVVDGASQFRRTYDESGKLVSLSMFDKIWAMSDPVTAGYGIKIWNSWGNEWSQNGVGVLTGSHAVPDGGVGVLTATPSAA